MSYRHPDESKDWRGTPIEEGATVIYGGGVGRSIQMVEAEVIGFHKDGKVRLKVVRRSFSGSYKEEVLVGHDRITVVTELPPCEAQTVAEEIADRAAKEQRSKELRATHDFKPRPKKVDPKAFKQDEWPYYDHQGYRLAQSINDDEVRMWYKNPCKNCKAEHYETGQVACPNGKD